MASVGEVVQPRLAEGRLSLEQEDYVRAEWLAHDAALRAEAPAVAALLDLNLHDGQVQGWDSTADTIRWRLLVGDLETGYEHATIESVLASWATPTPSPTSA